MNFKNIKVGQTIKNYKELCILLKEKGKTGKSKQIQLKNWERFFSYKKNANKYIITQIFSEPIIKIDMRGTSPNSRGHNTVYSNYIDSILINYFRLELNKNIDVLYETTNKLAYTVSLINWNYSTAFSDKNKYLNYVSEELNEKLNRTAMYNVFGCIKQSLKRLIRTSLERLKNKNLIEYEEIYMFIFRRKLRVADDDENEIVKKAEIEVLNLMGISNRNRLQYDDKLRKKYYEGVEELVKQEIKNVDSLFLGYKIQIMNEIKGFECEEEDKNTLNSIYIERTKSKILKLKLKNTLKYIGEPNPYRKDILNENYIEHAEYVINSLCDAEYENIKEYIKNQKIVFEDEKASKQVMSEQYMDIDDIEGIF